MICPKTGISDEKVVICPFYEIIRIYVVTYDCRKDTGENIEMLGYEYIPIIRMQQ